MFEESTLGTADMAFLVASLAITVFTGLYFANKNNTFAEYARGGGNQNLWAVSASMAAGYCSALTLIGNPSELYMYGTSFTLTMATTILAWPVASFVFLPVFKPLDGVSIFQYIENRFGPWLRRFVSVLFVLQMTFYGAVSLYLPSLPLFTALRVPPWLSVGLIGLVCIVYSSCGGLKAVTWTNLYHTILLLVTMFTIIVLGTIQVGGLGRVLQESLAAGRLSLGSDFFQLDLTTRHTIFNTVVSYTLVRLFLHGTSQMQVQSALSLSTMRKSQASQLISAIFYFLIQVVASAIGLLLLVSYRNCDPHLNGEINRQDELLMHYIHTRLNSVPVLQGMFIAAVFGSTLTIMSSYLSSTSAMLVEDFVRPAYTGFMHQKLTETRAAQVGKLASVALGLACMLLTFEMDKVSALQQSTTTLYGVIGIPILSAFLLGTMTEFVTERGMFAGMAASITFGAYVLVGHLRGKRSLEPLMPMSTAGCPRTGASQQRFPAGLESSFLGGEENGTRWTGEEFTLRQVSVKPLEPFELSQMSYLWLPLFTMTISVLVASLVSLFTGGLRQTVDNRFLAPKLTSALTAKTKEKLKQLSVAGCLSYESIEIKLRHQDECQRAAHITFVGLVERDSCFERGFCANEHRGQRRQPARGEEEGEGELPPV